MKLFQKSFHPIMGCVARWENLPIIVAENHDVTVNMSAQKIKINQTPSDNSLAFHFSPRARYIQMNVSL